MTTVKVNLRNTALSQYSAFPFTDFCMFNGRPLGAGPDGIFTLDGDGGDDVYTETTDEREVFAWVEYPMSTLGKALVKQSRKLYVTGEFNGAMTVTAVTAGTTETSSTYDITPRNSSYVQHTIEVPMSHLQKSEQWKFTLANVDGSDFSIDSIDGVFVPVTRRFGL